MRISVFTRRFISVFLSMCLLMTTVFMVGYREHVSAATTDVLITVGSGQTWTRPTPTNGSVGGTFTTIGSGAGSFYYSVCAFTVSQTADYSITSSNPTGSLDDAMFYLYTGSFNAASPVSPSFTIGNDDEVRGIRRNPIIASVTLTAGTFYYLVTTSFSPGATGSLSVRFNEPTSGTVTPLNVVTYTAAANGTISGSTPQYMLNGGSGTQVTAVADTGYHFNGWSDGALAETRSETNVTSDISLTADFAINQYGLTYTAGANGSISGNTPQTIDHGGSGTQVTAIPDAGYHFDGWSDGLQTITRTDTNLTASQGYTANFAINNYTLTYAAGAHGTVTGSASQSVDHGNNGATVTAAADTGYHFIGWSDSVMSESRTDLAVTKDITVTANFAINSYTLAYAVYAAGTNGTLTGNTAQSVEFGSNGSAVTAVPNTGYHFAGWSDGVLTESRTELNVMKDLSVTANFAINSYTLTYAAASNGTLTGIASQAVNHGSDGTAVTAVPATGYHFTGWSDGVQTATRTDMSVKANLAVTANFAINSYTLTYATGTSGTVSGVASQTVNHGSDGTAVTAVPATGYHFTVWSDGVLTATRTDMGVKANFAVTANFAINRYTVLFQSWDGSVLSEQIVDYGMAAISPANPVRSGYTFTSWSIPFTDVNGNVITVAVFSKNPTPTATPAPVTVVLAANTSTATPTAVPAGVLGAAKTGETGNQNMITAAFILLAALGVVGTVFVIRRKKNQE